MTTTTTATIAMLTFCCFTLAAAQRFGSKKQELKTTNGSCTDVMCPQPMCADPMSIPGECCPSCEHSKCMLEGCVQYESNGNVVWLPKPCMRCRCRGSGKLCTMYGCRRPKAADCPFGGRITQVGYKPDACCPRCDYNVPEQNCSVIPSKIKDYTFTSPRCFGPIVDYKCDKAGYRKGGKKYRCVEETGNKEVFMGKNCRPKYYSTVVSCKAVEDNSMQYAEGCDRYIN